MLQPRDIFSGIASKDIPTLKIKPNDKFWEIPISSYSSVLINAINKKIKSKQQKQYLIALVQYSNGEKIELSYLRDLFKVSGLSANSVSKDFGELLAPFYATRYLDKFMSNDNVKTTKGTIRHAYGVPGKKVDIICFPTPQNYPIFDFFIKNGYYFGFSVKAKGGSSNTLTPTYVQNRLEKLPEAAKKQLSKNYKNELDTLKALADSATFAGPIIAFGMALNNNKVKFQDKDKIKKILSAVDFNKDAEIIEKNKDKPINKLGLSNYLAYKDFIDEFIIDSTREPNKEDYKSGKKQYTTTNVVASCIKYLSSIEYNLEPILKELFPDLNIVKVGIKNGEPEFVLQTMIDVKDAIQESVYDLRSKAGFSRVNDKLGIQL